MILSYQAKTGRRKCILFLILLIVGLIIVLVYKPRGSSRTLPDGSDGIPVEMGPGIGIGGGSGSGAGTEGVGVVDGFEEGAWGR